LLAAAGVGLATSSDGGKSWQFDTEGLHGTYLRAVAVAGGTVLVTASTGPRTKHAAVYRKALDGNKNFERCQSGLPDWFSANIDTFCLTASGSRVAFGTSEGSAFVSSDEGQSWTVAAQDLPPVKSVALSPDPTKKLKYARPWSTCRKSFGHRGDGSVTSLTVSFGLPGANHSSTWSGAQHR